MSRLKLSPIELLYQECKEVMETESTALERDLTELFIEHLEDTIKHKELITIVIRGMVRKGKSTAGLMILMIINAILKKETTIKQIFSDQIEWTRFVTTTEAEKICVMCDEYSKVGEGSYNATTEQQLFGSYLEMFAVRYIHSIFITPSHSYNEHASIILDIIGKDEEKQETHFKLLYRNKVEGQTLLLGRITINVKEVLQKEFYKKYEKKKIARLDLLNKHGIRDIRELIFAKLTLQTYKELEPLANETKIASEMVSMKFQKIARQNKSILSIISETSITNRVRTLLNVKVIINKKEKEKQKEKDQKQAEKEINMMKEGLKELIQELEELGKIYEQYEKI